MEAIADDLVKQTLQTFYEDQPSGPYEITVKQILRDGNVAAAVVNFCAMKESGNFDKIVAVRESKVYQLKLSNTREYFRVENVVFDQETNSLTVNYFSSKIDGNTSLTVSLDDT